VFDLSADQKLDVLIVLFSIWLLVFTFSILYKLKLFTSGKDPERAHDRLTILENKGDYEAMLEVASWFLETQSKNIQIYWAKGRALYKLKRFEEAQMIFEDIRDTEPLWAEDANKYISSIAEKTHNKALK